jgi:hypothetical protein
MKIGAEAALVGISYDFGKSGVTKAALPLWRVSLIIFQKDTAERLV